MQSLFFTNALMLAGLAALAIPVLIHLLLKRRKKRLQFSTVRFFQQQDEQSSRRRKLRNWFLLALRLLIVALLVLAFARPYSHQSQASAAGRKQRRVVFVLDRSGSMLATGTEGQRWALAKERIRKSLSELSADDSAALVDCATHASVLSGFAPPATISQLVGELAPTYGNSNIPDALQEAVRLLSASGPSTTSTIYVVSDFQKSACRGLSSRPIPAAIEVKSLPVGDIFSPNVAIVAFDAERRDDARPHVTVASFSDEPTSSALDLSLDGQRVSSLTVELKAGGSTNIDLIMPPMKPGWHGLKASLRVKDSLEDDNNRYAALWVPEPAQVLVIESRGASPIFEQDSFFLASALDPTKDTTNSLPGAFSVTQVSPEKMADELSPSKGSSSWNVVIVPGLKDLPVGSGSALDAFVRAGGGLVLFLGEGMSANRYNGELADLLPARLGDAESSPELGSPWRIALYDTNCLAFSAFRLRDSGDLRIPVFTRRFTLEAGEGSIRLAFFEDGAPLVVTRSVGRGRVVLVNTSADTAWNDWPKHKTFVPFVHGLAKYAAQTSSQSTPHDENQYTAGEDFEIELGVQARSAQLTLLSPDGKAKQLTADQQGRVRDPGMSAPGVYALRDKNGHDLRRMAVNIPAQESDLDGLRASDFQQQLVRAEENPRQTLAAGLLGPRNNQREFWTALLLGVLMLLLVEPFVANRTSV